MLLELESSVQTSYVFARTKLFQQKAGKISARTPPLSQKALCNTQMHPSAGTLISLFVIHRLTLEKEMREEKGGRGCVKKNPSTNSCRLQKDPVPLVLMY